MDYLGSVDRADLYIALLADAKSKPTAKLLLRAALEDPAIKDGEELDITIVFADNFGEYGEAIDGKR